MSELSSGKMLGPGHSHQKKDTTEGHFSVGEPFSIGLVLVHWSNALTLRNAMYGLWAWEVQVGHCTENIYTDNSLFICLLYVEVLKNWNHLRIKLGLLYIVWGGRRRSGHQNRLWLFRNECAACHTQGRQLSLCWLFKETVKCTWKYHWYLD